MEKTAPAVVVVVAIAGFVRCTRYVDTDDKMMMMMMMLIMLLLLLLLLLMMMMMMMMMVVVVVVGVITRFDVVGCG